MAKTSIIVNTTEAGTGKKLQKTLTDINANASNQQLVSFAQALNSLTTNTYVETNRVDKSNCDEEAGGGVQTAFQHNLKINGSVNRRQTVAPGSTVTITYQDAVSTDAFTGKAELVVLQTTDDETWTPLSPTKKSENDKRDVVWEFTAPNVAETDVYIMLISTLVETSNQVVGWYGEATLVKCDNA